MEQHRLQESLTAQMTLNDSTAISAMGNPAASGNGGGAAGGAGGVPNYEYFNPPAPLGPPDNHLILDTDGVEPYDVDVTDPTGVLNYSNNSYVYCYAKNCPDLTTIILLDNPIVHMDVSDSSALTQVDLYDDNIITCEYLNVTGCTSVEKLWVDNNTSLTDIIGFNDLAGSLTSLSLPYTALTWESLDLSSFNKLTEVWCYYLPNLKTLNLSGSTTLTYLDCDTNQLTSLDVSTNTALTFLDCDDNQLTSLNLSGSTALTDLFCYSNQLTSLDVSTNTALTYLICNSNQLTQVAVDKILLDLVTNGKSNGYLDLSGGTNAAPSSTAPGSNYDILLTTRHWTVSTEPTPIGPVDNHLVLDADGVEPYDVDVTDPTGVLDYSSNSYVYCYARNCPNLTELYCNYNQLTSLNLSGSTALTNLQCYNNQLTSLDISTNTALTYFACDTNQLTSLDVSTNTALIILGCDDNKLTQVAVDKILLDLVTNGQTDGEVNLSGGTNAPPSSTAPGSNYDILVTTRNWVVTTK